MPRPQPQVYCLSSHHGLAATMAYSPNKLMKLAYSPAEAVLLKIIQRLYPEVHREAMNIADASSSSLPPPLPLPLPPPPPPNAAVRQAQPVHHVAPPPPVPAVPQVAAAPQTSVIWGHLRLS